MRKIGRNGKEGYDESSEANLINGRVKIVIQPPRGGDQTNDGGTTWVTEVRRIKKEREGRESGRYGMKHSHARQTDYRPCS